jgi:hypothetical protein
MKRWKQGVWFGLGGAFLADALCQTFITQDGFVQLLFAGFAGFGIWNHYRLVDNAAGSHAIRTDNWTWPVGAITAYSAIKHVLQTDKYVDAWGSQSQWSIVKEDKENMRLLANISVKHSYGGLMNVQVVPNNIINLSVACSPNGEMTNGERTNIELRWGGQHPIRDDEIWRKWMEDTRNKFQNEMEKRKK